MKHQSLSDVLNLAVELSSDSECMILLSDDALLGHLHHSLFPTLFPCQAPCPPALPLYMQPQFMQHGQISQDQTAICWLAREPNPGKFSTTWYYDERHAPGNKPIKSDLSLFTALAVYDLQLKDATWIADD